MNAMMLKDVVKEEIGKGKIVLFSSHQMSYIEEFCDSICILNQGKTAIAGELVEIKRNYPRNRLVVRSLQSKEILSDIGGNASSIGENELMITLSSPDDKQEVMSRLTEKFDIDEIRVFEPSLNDIFVEYAGENV